MFSLNNETTREYGRKALQRHSNINIFQGKLKELEDVKRERDDVSERLKALKTQKDDLAHKGRKVETERNDFLMNNKLIQQQKENLEARNKALQRTNDTFKTKVNDTLLSVRSGWERTAWS